MRVKDIKQYGMTFNDWNELYHLKGKDKGGTGFLESQLQTLKLAIDNAKELDYHYKYLANSNIERWNFNG